MSEQISQCKVKVNDFEFSFPPDLIQNADLLQITPNEFHLLQNGRSVKARLLEADMAAKRMALEVDGAIFHVEIKDALDQLVDSMGYGKSSHKQIKEIKAPMPGLVLEIAVIEGQEVEEGAKLLILVAMKMENSISIAFPSKIKRIAVSVGQAVEKGQLLVELD